MSQRSAWIALVVGANLAVVLIFAAQRGCFDAPRPKSVRHIDLESFQKYAEEDSKACLAEFHDQWVLVGGTVIEVKRIAYEFTEKWYVRLGVSPQQEQTPTTLEFDGDPGGKLRLLKKGDPITVIGRVASVKMFDRCTMTG